jgi:hypothetical protein
MTNGFLNYRISCKHRWENDGEPSTTIRKDVGGVAKENADGTWDLPSDWDKEENRIPFRQLQRCPRCRASRCLECATGEVVA